MTRFDNFPALTESLAYDLTDAVEALGLEDVTVSVGFSNQSCSSYVTVERMTEDEDGDEDFEEIKIRFSDHADRYGSDMTLRIDDKVETITEDGEYVAIEIDPATFSALIAQAMTEVEQFIKAAA